MEKRVEKKRFSRKKYQLIFWPQREDKLLGGKRKETKKDLKKFELRKVQGNMKYKGKCDQDRK